MLSRHLLLILYLTLPENQPPDLQQNQRLSQPLLDDNTLKMTTAQPRSRGELALEAR